MTIAPAQPLLRRLTRVSGWLLLPSLLATLYTLLVGVPQQPSSGALSRLGLLAVLVVLDVIEARRSLTVRVALAFCVARIVAVEWLVVGYDHGIRFWLYPLLLYRMAHYAETAACVVAALALATLVLRETVPIWLRTHPINRMEALNDPITLAQLLLFALALAHVRASEQRHRLRAAHDLRTLQATHRAIDQAAQTAIIAVQERQQVVRTIHDELGQDLTAIALQLDVAWTYRERDAHQSQAAIRNAKQSASAALRHVRESVAVLRSQPVQVPAVIQPAPPRRDHAARRLVGWLFPHSFDLAPTTLALSTLLLVYIGEWPLAAIERQAFGWLTLGLGLLLVIDRLDVWLWRGSAPLTVRIGLLLARMTVLASLWYGLPVLDLWAMLWFILLLPYYGFVALGRRTGLLLAGLLLIVQSVLVWLLNDADVPSIIDLVTGTFTLGTFWAIVVVTSLRMLADQRAVDAIAQLHRDQMLASEHLESYTLDAIVAGEQRTHLARELHDGLGHYLTVINVQLEKALAFAPLDSAVATQALADARRYADDALHDVRGTRQVLALGSTQTIRTAIEALARGLPAPIVVTSHVTGSEQGFASSTLLALYRIAQEALTNVQRHAAAGSVRIELYFGIDVATLTIVDDGRGFDPASTPIASYGLVGARERAALVGGTLTIRSTPDAGTTVSVQLPRQAHGVIQPVNRREVRYAG